MVKVLELHPGDDTLILKALRGLHSGLLGSSVGPIEPDNPPAQALMTARPAVAQVHTWDPERVPAILREFSVASSINVPLISRDGPGAIEVALASGEADIFVLEVRDNGKGYGETARDNTGMQTARRLVTSIGGSLQRIPAPDRGTIWRISMTRDG